MKPSFGLDKHGRMRIRLVLPLPPTDNQIYFNLKIGGRALTDKARAYKAEVKKAITQLAVTSNMTFKKDVPYTQVIHIYFGDIENKSFGAKRGAKQRYKKIDTTNRVKLVTDAISEAIGVDDRHIFRSVVEKRSDQDYPRLEVLWREQDPRD